MAALCSLLPFLYFFIFLFRARICFSSAESTFFSFFNPAFIPFFMPAFFALLTRRAILPFSFFIAAIAALCSLLPFLYFFIFAFSLSMAFFSCARSLCSFFFSLLLPAFIPFFMPAFFAFLTRRAILRFSAAIFFIAALCSLLPFLYLDIFLFRA